MKFQYLEFNYRDSVVNDELYIVFIFRRTRKIAKGDQQLRHVRPSVCLSASKNSAPTGRIFMKFHVLIFFENPLKMLKIHRNLIRTTGTLHENLRTFLIISRSFPRNMRNVSDKSCGENQNTHFVISNFSPPRKSYHL
jgi:hypothetical protein